MSGRILKAALFAATLLGAGQVWAADYQREREWAVEIKANLSVGDPIDFTLKQMPYPFLGIFAPGDSDRAVILVHDLGLHPDSGLIRELRVALHEHGYTTLALQMPLLAADADPHLYRDEIPEGASRISRGASFLENQGYGKILVVGHGLGARMANLYMTKPSPYVRAWASLGNTDPGLASPKVAVLDLYAENDERFVAERAKKRAKTFKNKASKQQVIADTDHFYEGREAEAVAAIAAFFDKVVGKPVLPKPEPGATDAPPVAAAPAETGAAAQAQ